MVATFITLCNSACITCIWCFLLSICFPKFVNIMKETESSEFYPQKVKKQSGFSESVEEEEIKKRNGERQEVEFEKKQDSRRVDKNSQRERSDVINGGNRRSRDVGDIHSDQFTLYKCSRSQPDSMGSGHIDKDDRNNIDFGGQEMFANRLERSHRRNGAGPPRNKYRLCRKLSSVASDLEECFLKRINPTAKEFYSGRTAKCHGCGNNQSGLQKNL